MHYLFKELAEDQIKVSFNFFCEKHGKNSRDQHFSVISNFIHQESMIKQLTSSKDICDAIIKRQTFANLEKIRLNELQKNTTSKPHDTVTTEAFVIPLYTNSVVTCSELIVSGLQKYYNFYTDNAYNLKTHLMSDQVKEISLISTIKIKSLTIERNENIVDKIQPVIFNNEYLNSKMLNWKVMQRESRTSNINSSEFSSDYDSDSLNNIYCKLKCKDCQITCRFRLSEINNLKKTQVHEELKYHGHPKSRTFRTYGNRKRNRTISEAKGELRSHYINNHYHQ